ncbi:hypothetical protein ABHI18_000433 [Aspergillus niger]
MPPPIPHLLRRKFEPGVPSIEFYVQWTQPSDVFSVLLILGGDVVGRALAQVAGSPVTPVAFSFGWVVYSVTAVVTAIGENKLMAPSGLRLWIIGRIVRDFDSWMDNGKRDGRIKKHLRGMLDQRLEKDRRAAEKKKRGSAKDVAKPSQTGLCVSIYKADHARPGYPGYDLVYFIGFGSTVLQLVIAAIPCGIFGDWGIFLVTVPGILLSFATGSLSQWSKEKWACRRNSQKTVILTRGNGSQHAIVIIGDGRGLDLEDLAAGPTNKTWFLLAIGGVGILQNIFVAGWRRFPRAFGVPLEFCDVIGEPKVMDTLFAVETDYSRVGRSMRDTFFPGKLLPEEEKKWHEFEKVADALDDSLANARRNG